MLKSTTKIIMFIITVLLISACNSAPKKSSSLPVELPSNSLHNYQRGVQFARSGNDTEAIKEFTLLTQRTPNAAIGYTSLGLLYLKQGDYQSAQDYFFRAIQLDPNDKIAHNHLGISLRNLGKFKDAEESYLSAISIDNDYADAHHNLAVLYDIYLQELPLALKHYKYYQSLNNGNDNMVTKWLVDLERRISSTR